MNETPPAYRYQGSDSDNASYAKYLEDIKSLEGLCDMYRIDAAFTEGMLVGLRARVRHALSGQGADPTLCLQAVEDAMAKLFERNGWDA